MKKQDMEIKMTTALFLGRFQPFHLGHLHVIREALTKYDNIKIAICSSQEHHTDRNPYTVWERYDMIHNSLQEAGIFRYEVIPIPDLHNPERWTEFITVIFGECDVVYTNNPDTSALFKSIGVKVEGTSFGADGVCSTMIREHIKHNLDVSFYVPPYVIEFLGVRHERIKNI